VTWVNIADEKPMWDFISRMADPPRTVPIGLPMIDKAMKLFGNEKGIPQGTYMIIGGASNVGKTQMGLWCLKQAARSGNRGGIISLDMRPYVATARLYQGIIGKAIPLHRWMPSGWDMMETSKMMIRTIEQWARDLGQGEIHISLDCKRDLGSVCDAVRSAHDEQGITYFVIDHMQKIKVDGMMGNNVAGRAEIVSEAMDDLVDDLEITIVGLSQLNRAALADRTRQPTLSDLWGGTAMESNAGVVIILDHSRYQRDNKHHHLAKTWVLLEKNQQGPKGIEVPVEWNHAELDLREADPHEEELWPSRDSATKSTRKTRY